jgi:hypothetical protein
VSHGTQLSAVPDASTADLVPAVHGWHAAALVCAGKGWYVPRKHEWHACFSSAPIVLDQVPGLQGMQPDSFVFCVVSAYFPATHLVQLLRSKLPVVVE